MQCRVSTLQCLCCFVLLKLRMSVIFVSVGWNLGIMITKGMMQIIKQHNNCGNINVYSNINT